MTIMKVIFLDVDEVLVTHRCKGIGPRSGYNGSHGKKYHFDQESVKWLNYLVARSGAKVVVSSVWRIGATVEELNNLFKFQGLELEVIGKTPKFNESSCRGREIKDWLEKNGANVTKYVIIDDDAIADCIQDHPNNCVDTSFTFGLTRRKMEDALKILGCIKPRGGHKQNK